ncbi:MAG: substrate-binding domain-containing protein, partial [Candidatus Sumerlaeota bacterium]
MSRNRTEKLAIDRAAPTPLYRQIYEYFRDAIMSGEMGVGECLPSIRALQRDTGVARESIKQTMGLLDDHGLVRKIQGKGTFVAPRKASRSFWGVVVPFYAEFYNQMIVELRKVAARRGIEVEHACDYDDYDRQAEIVDGFAWRQAEAVILVPCREEKRAVGHLVRAARRQPLVLFDRTSIASALPYVIQDYALGVNLAVDAMIKGGARNIGYVRDPLWQPKNPIYQTMEQAYHDACDTANLEYRTIWDSPYDIAQTQLQAPEFDALMCVNDQVACLTVGLLKNNGIDVPGDVQVAGYNNSDVGRFFTPRITTTDPDLERMCQEVENIIDRSR